MTDKRNLEDRELESISGAGGDQDLAQLHTGTAKRQKLATPPVGGGGGGAGEPELEEEDGPSTTGNQTFEPV